MSYEKQTFVDWELDESGNVVKEGTTLSAEHLRHIEEGIVANEQALDNKQPKGDYPTKTEVQQGYQPKGSYLTEHQKLKTVNGQSLVGDGDISIERCLKLKGKKVMFFGDSITEKSYFYRDALTALTGIKTVGCFAVSGATFKGGVVSDLHGDPAFGKAGNHLSNQIQKLLNNVSNYEVPDIVIISASINDGTGIVSPTNYDESQFTTEDGEYVDVDTCSLSTFTGAARWAYEKIMSVYPKALVVFCTPLQARWAKGFESSKSKRDAIVSVCERMSVPYIDAFYDSGVYGRYEFSGSNGKYLRDGIHPNEAGAVALAKCYARKLEYLMSMEEFSYDDDAGGNTGGNTGDNTGGDNTGGDSGDNSGGDNTGGNTGDIIDIDAKINVTGTIVLVACNGTHNLKKFTPVTNGEEGGEVPWTYVSLESSLYEAADNARIAGTEIKSGAITKDGDYIEDIVLDATHAVIFQSATGDLKICYTGSPNELFTITTNSALYVSKNPAFYTKMSLGGKYELASE